MFQALLLSILKSLLVNIIGELPNWTDPQAVQAWLVQLAGKSAPLIQWIEDLIGKLTPTGIRVSVTRVPCIDVRTSTAVLACAAAGDDLVAAGKISPEQWAKLFKFVQTVLPLVLQIFVK